MSKMSALKFCSTYIITRQLVKRLFIIINHYVKKSLQAAIISRKLSYSGQYIIEDMVEVKRKTGLTTSSKLQEKPLQMPPELPLTVDDGVSSFGRHLH